MTEEQAANSVFIRCIRRTGSLRAGLAKGLIGLFCVALSAQGQTEGTLRLTDQTGQAVTLKKPASRVIVIPVPMLSMMLAIDGGTEKIVGMNAAVKSDLTEGLLGKIFPAAINIPAEVAGETFAPNSEALAAARPDLVVQWGDRGEAVIAPIRALGIPVLGMRYGNTLWVADWMRLIGKAIGRSERADFLANAFTRKMDELTKEAARILPSERPGAIYLYRARSAIIAAGKGSTMDGDIRRLGGINPAENLPGFAPVDVEQLLTWNPEIILLNNAEPGLTPDVIYKDPRLQGMKAVKSRRVYLFPRGGFRWDLPSQESTLGAQWLFNVLYPAHAPKGKSSLRRAMAAAYQELYGYSLSEAETDQILRMDKNSISAHYEALFSE